MVPRDFLSLLFLLVTDNQLKPLMTICIKSLSPVSCFLSSELVYNVLFSGFLLKKENYPQHVFVGSCAIRYSACCEIRFRPRFGYHTLNL